MRSISQIECDKKKREAIARSVVENLKEYVKLENDIHERSIVTIDWEFQKNELCLINEGMDALDSVWSGDALFTTRGLLHLASSCKAKHITDDECCPSCKAPFPGELWDYNSTLYCPYCGQKVIRSIDEDSLVDIFGLD